jgi:hypothetical protein
MGLVHGMDDPCDATRVDQRKHIRTDNLLYERDTLTSGPEGASD